MERHRVSQSLSLRPHYVIVVVPVSDSRADFQSLFFSNTKVCGLSTAKKWSHQSSGSLYPEPMRCVGAIGETSELSETRLEKARQFFLSGVKKKRFSQKNTSTFSELAVIHAMSSLPCRPRTSLIPLAWVLSPSWQPAFERFCNKIRGKKSAVLVSAPWDFNVILLTVLRWWHLAFKIQLTALTFGPGGTCFIRLRVYLCLEIERVEMQTKVMIGTAGLVCMNVRAARVWRGIYKNSKSFLSDVECYTRGQCSAPVFGLEFIYSGRRGGMQCSGLWWRKSSSRRKIIITRKT